ncbi:MAG: class I SAM-dependent methyltransferase [Dehalococcoidales bacterium]|nr:class I SAM-dependent methyltransferase [Dehalococcoidales bacterium]
MTDYPGPEKMNDFFTVRLEGYDEHMLTSVGTANYTTMAELVPEDTVTLLDLGCGTGLELDEIFKKLPDIKVTGIDLTQPMLDQLKQKYPAKDLILICGDYRTVDLGIERYDCVISVQTIHHFLEGEKTALYRKIRGSLKPGGLYIESDYTASDQAMQDECYKEYRTVREENKITGDELYHIDIPFTLENRISMLKKAGFISVEAVFRLEYTVIIVAKK